MDDKISVIIPVYNVEEYLNKCLDSVIKQTYTNLEIILVNDGSTDNCGNICDSYARKDKRIKVIHKKNGGLSDARNKGIEVATGSYIGFVDSDDWIDDDMYEFLHDLIVKNNADIALCRYKGIYKSKIVDESTDYFEVCDGISAIKKTLVPKQNYHYNFGVFTKLYKRELFNNLRFIPGVLHEDVYFTPKILYMSNRCVYIDKAKYNYLIERPGSIMNSGVNEKKIIDEINGLKDIEEFFKYKNENELREICKVLLLKKIMISYYLVSNSNIVEKSLLLGELEKDFKEIINKRIKRKLDNKTKAKVNLFLASPKFYRFLTSKFISFNQYKKNNL